MEYLALDIETETTVNGLDPNVAAITEIALSATASEPRYPPATKPHSSPGYPHLNCAERRDNPHTKVDGSSLRSLSRTKSLSFANNPLCARGDLNPHALSDTST